MKKKKKMKKWVKWLIFILIALIFLALCTWYLINNFTDKGKGRNTIKVIDEIKDYGYTLDENETKLYKDLFRQLAKTLDTDNVDEKEYAELITKLFVADFYNLDNKITKNDIGGTQFIHSGAVDNFVLKAKDTFYKGIKSDIYGDRKQDLPVVEEINLDEVNDTTFTLNDEEVDAYSVTLNWKYEDDLGYEDEKEFILVHEDKKLSIVQMNDIDENNESSSE